MYQDTKSSKIYGCRGVMDLYANENENFINHHLKSEIHLSKYTRGSLIRRRQILEHNS
jgi:hypothetical protein